MVILEVPFPTLEVRTPGLDTKLPPGAEVVAVQFTPPHPSRLHLMGADADTVLILYVMLDPEEAPSETRRFAAVRAGQPFNPTATTQFIGTAQRWIPTSGKPVREVWHVFEIDAGPVIALAAGAEGRA